MASHIGRRKFLATLLGGTTVAWLLPARAQQPAMPVIGFLNSGSAAEWVHLVAAFKEGLSELGYVEGRNVAVDYRWAQGQNDRVPTLAADLVARQVAVIVTMGGMTTALAAKAATATIPIVFIAGADPIDSGLVTSISRPTSNVTGINIFADVLTPKRQELLHELVPTASFVAMLVNPTAAQTQSELCALCSPRLTGSINKYASSARAPIVSLTRPLPPSSISGSAGCSCNPTHSLPAGGISSCC